MKRLLLPLALVCILLAGCSLLDTIAPPQYDEAGNPIPGSRQATEITRTVADSIPWGGLALNILLLGVAGFEKFNAYRAQKGLMATLLAGKQIADDPKMKELWEETLLSYYKNAHKTAGVFDYIKTMLAKI